MKDVDERIDKVARLMTKAVIEGLSAVIVKYEIPSAEAIELFLKKFAPVLAEAKEQMREDLSTE